MHKAGREMYWWEHYPLHKWWCNDYLPIVPRCSYSEKDEWNSSKFGVHWLIFNIWSMSHFSFGADVEVSFDRITGGITLPFLRIMIGFMNLPSWSIGHKYFYRKGTKQ